VLLLAGVCSAWAADSHPISVYPCPEAETAPVVDGKLDDAVWQQAPVVSGFAVLGTDTPTNPQTFFRVMWDDRCLYLGVHCDEPLMDKVNVVRYDPDEHLFGSECVELFVDPNHTHQLYYQLAVSVAGSLYDGEITTIRWNSNAQVKTHLGPDFWSVEMAVPWEPLKATPAPGKVVGFNINRNRHFGENRYATWARLGNNFHAPGLFAHLVLSGTPDTVGKLSAEFRKGERTGPVVVYGPEGFAQTSYAHLATTALADVEKILADLDAKRVAEEDAAVAAAIGGLLEEYRATFAELKPQGTGKLDAATWTRLDLALQDLVVRLRRAVAEARLQALFDRI
jgi:hypothetical protein